jgi:hypothetical protein
VSTAQGPLAWSPHSIAQASLIDEPDREDADLPRAHDYELADYGLTPDGVRERFAEYLRTYDASA